MSDPTTTTTTTTTTTEEPPPLPVATFAETDLVPQKPPETPSMRWERRKKKVVLPLVAVSALSSLAAALLYHQRLIDGVLGYGFVFVMPVIISSLLALLTPKKTSKQTIGYTALVHLATFAVTAVIGEGAICLLMATPILFGVSSALALMTKSFVEEGLLPRADKKYRALLAILISVGLPPAARSFDQAMFGDPGVRDVTSARIHVDAAPDRVWASLQHLDVRFDAPQRWTWAWLLPAPTALVGDGARVGAVREVRFENGTVAAIVTHLDAPRRYDIDLAVTESGREFFDHWIDLKTSRFDIEDDSHGGSFVVHTTTYRPLMYPRFVFRPLEHFFGGLIQQELLDTYGDAVLPRVQAAGAPLAQR